MNITHISVSRKLVFDECQKMYHFKYHLKTTSPEPEKMYFTYGKIVHKIAEVYVQNRGEENLKEITQKVLDGEIAIEDYAGEQQLAPPLPHEYKKRLVGHLNSIRKLTQQIGYDGELEWKFRYDLDPPNEKFIVGYIDRLIRRDDNFFIFDYKTTKKGRWRKTPRTILSDLQLRCYAKVVQNEFDVPAEKIQAALYYLEGGNLLGVRFSQASLDYAEKVMLSTYKTIEAIAPENVRANVGKHCSRCDFRKLCAEFKSAKTLYGRL